MCMLTYIPSGVQPEAGALRKGAEFNNDGHGFGIVNGTSLIVNHSMDAEWAIAEFVRLRAEHPAGPALFHSRYGTGGLTTTFNCHPFCVGDDRQTVIGHNGILPPLVRPTGGDKRCDTRIAAEDLLAGWDLGDPQVHSMLEEWMGPHNKFVILTANSRYGQSAYILNESAGIWDKSGIWYSNDDYLPDARSVNWLPSACWSDRKCPYCGLEIEIADEGYCYNCQRCLDCAQDWHECECYVPSGTLLPWRRNGPGTELQEALPL